MLVTILLLIFTLLVVRLLYLVIHVKLPRQSNATPVVTMVVLGSGGHTMEMLRLLSGMDLVNFSQRVYVAADADVMSIKKIIAFEQSHGNGEPLIKKIPRARQVLESYISAVLSTLIAIFYSFPITFKTSPDLLLCNGPGTCIPLCFWCFVLKFFWIKDVNIVYVESICRVKTLSLSALILYFIADHILVQWSQLQKAYPRTEYIGRVI